MCLSPYFFLKPTLKTVYGLEYESGGKRYKYRMGFMKPNLLLNKNKKKVEKGPGVLLWSILLASIWGIVEIVDPLGNHVPYIYAILYRWRYIFIVKHFYLDSSVCVQKKEKKILIDTIRQRKAFGTQYVNRLKWFLTWIWNHLCR